METTTVKPYGQANRLTSIQSAGAGTNQLPQACSLQKEFCKLWAIASSAPDFLTPSKGVITSKLRNGWRRAGLDRPGGYPGAKSVTQAIPAVSPASKTASRPMIQQPGERMVKHRAWDGHIAWMMDAPPQGRFQPLAAGTPAV